MVNVCGGSMRSSGWGKHQNLKLEEGEVLKKSQKQWALFVVPPHCPLPLVGKPCSQNTKQGTLPSGANTYKILGLTTFRTRFKIFQPRRRHSESFSPPPCLAYFKNCRPPEVYKLPPPPSLPPNQRWTFRPNVPPPQRP